MTQPGHRPDAPNDATALDVLGTVTDTLLGVGRTHVDAATARIVERDPQWDERACTRTHVARMWRDLQRAVTNEIGSTLTRVVDDFDGDDPDRWAPRIVIAEPEEFPTYVDDDPWGWRPLADAHRREANWDFAPTPDAGLWLGTWEPEGATSTGDQTTLTGTLTGFVIVGDDGDLRFAHVVKNRRRTGTASRLVEHAAADHGLRYAPGPHTRDGAAFVASVGLPTTPP